MTGRFGSTSPIQWLTTQMAAIWGVKRTLNQVENQQTWQPKTADTVEKLLSASDAKIHEEFCSILRATRSLR